jgi:hypothetical protein
MNLILELLFVLMKNLLGNLKHKLRLFVLTHISLNIINDKIIVPTA